jgi:hypothetical protein
VAGWQGSRLPDPVRASSTWRAVPEDGLTDVHRYLVITLGNQDVIIDITFPSDPPWEGAARCG